MPDDDIESHPDLAPAAAAMREEWRTEQEAATADAAQDWYHRKSLVDVFREHMHCGDRIAIVVTGWRVVGVPEEVGDDLVAIRTLGGRVDVHLAPTIPLWHELYEHSTEGGHRGVDAAGGRFVNALMMHEGEMEATVGTVFDPGGMDGRLSVGADHVVIVARGGAQTFVPIAQVAWVSPRRE
ncbi:MAG: hypothetical protein ACT4OX_08370 [Actinomycetota bacterium]